VQWNLSVVLICISFMARDSKHFFMCFLAIWTSLERLCSVHLPVSSLGHWFLGEFSHSITVLIMYQKYHTWIHPLHRSSLSLLPLIPGIVSTDMFSFLFSLFLHLNHLRISFYPKILELAEKLAFAFFLFLTHLLILSSSVF
jgi:hypothetical protein